MAALDPKTQLITGKILEIAQQNMAEDGYLSPIAFVGNADGMTPPIVPQQLSSQQDKDVFATMIRMTGVAIDATWVMIILESWMRVANKEEAEAYKNSTKRVSEYADKKEVVFVSIETKKGTFTGFADIKTDSAGKKSFDMPSFEQASKGSIEGTFSNLLPLKEV